MPGFPVKNQVLVQTKPKTELETGLQTSPVTVGELAVAFQHCIPIAVQRGLPCSMPRLDGVLVPVDFDMLALMLADLLEAPVARGSVKIEAQVGRFMRVQYAPRQASDPTTILTLIPGAQSFHRAALVLSNSNVYSHWNDTSWYREAKDYAKCVLSELGRLQPLIQEAELVLRWITQVLAYGNRRS